MFKFAGILIIAHCAFSLAFASNNLTVSAESEAQRKQTVNYDFYSESYSSAYFNGFVTQSRLRLLYPLLSETIQPYAGVNLSSDFTGSKTIRFADDFASPTAGILLKPFSFIGLFAEYRRLYRLVDNELPEQENDPRYGSYVYFLKPLPLTIHAELYGESIILQRFTQKPVTSVWLKLGKEFSVFNQSTSLTPYLEGFYRESPSTMIGINEQSLRFGTKLKWHYKGWSASLIGYRRFSSDSVPNGWEGFLVLSANGGLLPWN